MGRIGTKDALPDGMPSLCLVLDPTLGETTVRRVAEGCEEEGIPLSWDEKTGTAADLARFACMRAQLGVGIGVDREGNGAVAMVTVTEAPYVTRRAVEPEELRWLGLAAARISKSQPIMHAERTEAQTKTAPAVLAELPETAPAEHEIVAALVHEILKKMQEGGMGGHG